MRNIILFALSFISSLAYSQNGPKIKHVVVIGVDGLSAYGVKKIHTPVFDSLMEHGAYSLKAKAVTPTLSSPNWASMIMGVTPADHHIMDNSWRRDKQVEIHHCESDTSLTHPTIFRIVRHEYPNIHIVIFHQWKEFEGFIEPGIPSTIQHTSDELQTAIRSTEYLPLNMPELTFIHFDHVDKAGHTYGHRSKQYKKAVKRTDSLIGALVSAVNNSPMKDSTIFLITSDHGFWGKHHGGITRKEKLIPWIMVGPGIRKGWRLKERVDTFDTASTLAYIFSVKAPVCWKGKVVKEAFMDHK